MAYGARRQRTRFARSAAWGGPGSMCRGISGRVVEAESPHAVWRVDSLRGDSDSRCRRFHRREVDQGFRYVVEEICHQELCDGRDDLDDVRVAVAGRADVGKILVTDMAPRFDHAPG